MRRADHEHRVPVGRVKPGDVVVVRPGERIPCDGEVIKGQSNVDQAILTGESGPVCKCPGNTVYTGTMNGNGPLEIRSARSPNSRICISAVFPEPVGSDKSAGPDDMVKWARTAQ